MSSIRGPLLGTSLRRESATEVALGLDSLRHGGKVETLNFAYLNVPEGSILAMVEVHVYIKVNIKDKT